MLLVHEVKIYLRLNEKKNVTKLSSPTRKAIWHSMNTYPMCDSPLYWRDAAFASLQKSRRNHPSYVGTEALSTTVFVPPQTSAIQYSVSLA